MNHKKLKFHTVIIIIVTLLILLITLFPYYYLIIQSFLPWDMVDKPIITTQATLDSDT